MSHYTHLSGIYKTVANNAFEKERLLHEEEKRQKHPIPDNKELKHFLSHLKNERAFAREENILLTRQQISESVKADLLITNTVAAIEETDKVINLLSRRIREWYALYDPELEHSFKDHHAFVEAITTRTNERAENTMGGTLSDEDLHTIKEQAEIINGLFLQREKLVSYLDILMQQHAPNMKHIAGAMIGGKLISLAGSLERLSRLPSGTVQLLGAETALFKHLRNKKIPPPKHGIIFNHLLMQRSHPRMHGKVARLLADKISIAVKIDYFKGDYKADELYAQIERKLKDAEEEKRNAKKRA